MLNGLIGETDSLIKAILATIDENFDQKRIPIIGHIILELLGLLVIVPSNPETNFFQLAEGVVSIMRNHEWGNQNNFIKARIWLAIINYLGT